MHQQIQAGTSKRIEEGYSAGMRRDACASEHRIPLGKAKPGPGHGEYLHAELCGDPVRMRVGDERRHVAQIENQTTRVSDPS